MILPSTDVDRAVEAAKRILAREPRHIHPDELSVAAFVVAHFTPMNDHQERKA